MNHKECPLKYRHCTKDCSWYVEISISKIGRDIKLYQFEGCVMRVRTQIAALDLEQNLNSG